MALSDCIHCWETPCMCGYGYRNWNVGDLQDLIAVLTKILNQRIALEAAEEGIPDKPNKMIKINGKPFRCSCGANVFQEFAKYKYLCNGCNAAYVGEVSEEDRS